MEEREKVFFFFNVLKDAPFLYTIVLYVVCMELNHVCCILNGVEEKSDYVSWYDIIYKIYMSKRTFYI